MKTESIHNFFTRFGRPLADKEEALQDFLKRYDGIYGDGFFGRIPCQKCGSIHLFVEARKSCHEDVALFLRCDDCGNQWIVSLGQSTARKMCDRFAEDRHNHV